MQRLCVGASVVEGFVLGGSFREGLEVFGQVELGGDVFEGLVEPFAVEEAAGQGVIRVPAEGGVSALMIGTRQDHMPPRMHGTNVGRGGWGHAFSETPWPVSVGPPPSTQEVCMAVTARRAAACALTLALAAGCSSQSGDQRVVSQRLLKDLTGQGGGVAGWATADLKKLSTPSQQVRETLKNSNTVYRVIEVTPDAALLAFWRTAPPGPEPFSRNKVALGRTCVRVQKTNGEPTVVAADCPGELADEIPSSDIGVWGRDAEAVEVCAIVAAAISDEVRWTLFRNDDATEPRTQVRNTGSITAAIEKANLPSPQGPTSAKITVERVQRVGSIVTVHVRVDGTAIDATDTARTVTAIRRYIVRADLSIHSANGHQNWVPVSEE